MSKISLCVTLQRSLRICHSAILHVLLDVYNVHYTKVSETTVSIRMTAGGELKLSKCFLA